MARLGRRAFILTGLLGATALTPAGRALAQTGSLQDVGRLAVASPRATVYPAREVITLDPARPSAEAVAVVGDRIREYEDRVHPWPDTSTPASALSSLMAEHGLRQSDLPEVGSQGVVSEVLAGKRQLNARQVAALARRFQVAAEVFLP